MRSKPKVTSFDRHLILAILWLGASIVTKADPLDYWHWRTPYPQGNALTGVAFGNGRYVAVGYRGTTIVSRDGKVWGAGDGLTNDLYGIDFAGDRFLAQGDAGLLFWSTNGLQWQQCIATGTNTLSEVIFSRGIYVAIGYFGTIITSTNGILWQRENTDSSASLRSIVDGGGSFYVFGDNPPSSVLVSADGHQWRKEPIMAPAFDDAAHWNGRFFGVVGSKVYASHNVRDWSEQQIVKGSLFLPAYAFGLSKLRVGEEQLLAMGRQSKFYVSNNGDTWRDSSSQESLSFGEVDAAFGDRGWVAVAADGSIRISPRGEGWALRSRGHDDSIASVATGPGKIVVFHEGAVSTSTNGVAWERDSAPILTSVQKAVYGNGRYVAIGPAGKSFLSENGWQWLAVPTGVTNLLADVVFGNGQFLAIGSGSLALVSADGQRWAHRSIPGNPSLRHATFGNGMFMLTAPNLSVWGSSNTVDWTKFAVSGKGNLDQIVFAFGRFYVSGLNPNGYDEFWQSSVDGVTWKRVEAISGRSFLQGMTFGGGLIVGSSRSGDVLTSIDGETWTRRATPVSYRPDSFVFGLDSFFGLTSTGIVQSDPMAPSPPIIGIEPEDIMTVEGRLPSVQLSAAGSSPLRYQWYLDGKALANETNAAALLDQDSLSGVHDYFAVVTNTYGAVTSRVATITVRQTTLPAIGLNPEAALVRPGQNALFTVNTSGSGPITYQWFHNGEPLPGERDATLQIASVGPAQVGEYSVTISNRAGLVRSQGAQLTLTAPDPLDVWTRVSPNPSTPNWTTVTFGNGLYLAGGDDGSVLRSSDGVTWTNTVKVSDRAINQLLQTNELFLAVDGAGRVFISGDALSWRSTTVSSNRLNGIAFGLGMYVVVGEGGTIFTSMDLAGWQRQTSNISDSLKSIVCGAGRFVAVGDGGVILTSTNGAAWTKAPFQNGALFTGVSFGKGLFVASAVQGYATSTNGLSWRSGTIGFYSEFTACRFLNNEFVLIGSSELYSSPDGKAWEGRLIEDASPLQDICRGTNGLYVVAGSQGEIWTTSDWTSVWQPRRGFPRYYFFTRIIEGSGHFIALAGRVGTSSQGGSVLCVSEDGRTWGAASISGLPVFGLGFSCLAYGNGIYLAGASGGVATSKDGTNWVAVAPSPAIAVQRLTFGDGKFVGVTAPIRSSILNPIGTDPIRSVAVSTNGILWKQQPLPTEIDLIDITCKNGTFFGCGTNSVHLSSDGLNWKPVATFLNATIVSITAGPDGLVVVGSTRNQPPYAPLVWIASSRDGVNWKVQPGFEGSPRRVAFGADVFSIVGYDGLLLTSTDGEHWTRRDAGATAGLLDAAGRDGRLVLVGEDGAIITCDLPLVLERALVLQATPGPTGTELRITGPNNLLCTIETSDRAKGPWVPLGNVRLSSEGVALFQDARSGNIGSHFFRVRKLGG